jgi:ribosomal-protein-serine acetyltransferase
VPNPHDVDSEIKLVVVEESLAIDLFHLIDSDREHLNRWLPWPPLNRTIEDITDFVKKSISDYREGISIVFAIQYLGDIVGVISYNKIDKSLKKVELGYWLTSSAQGQGIVTRASRYLIGYAFDCLEAERVQIATAAENSASRKVCERLGCKLEGVISNCENLHGKIVSHAIYSIGANET